MGVFCSLASVICYSFVGLESSFLTSCLFMPLPVIAIAHCYDISRRQILAKLPKFTSEILPGEVSIQEIIIPAGRNESGTCTCGCFVATPHPADPSFTVISREPFFEHTFEKTPNEAYTYTSRSNERSSVSYQDEFPPNYIPVYNFAGSVSHSKQ